MDVIPPKNTLTLANLNRGQRATIVGYGPCEDHWKGRLGELGLLPGTQVSIEHQAPWGLDPIAVRIRGSLFGFRKKDVACVLVEPL